MRITIVQGAFLPVPPLRGGAVEKVWLALGREFARRGHQVTHISRLCDNLPADEAINGVHHLRVPGYDTPSSALQMKWSDLLYSRRAARVLPPADILITNTFWLPLLVRDASRGKLYVHVARFPKRQHRFYTRAARLQCVSSVVANHVRAQAPALASRVRVLPNPLPEGIWNGQPVPASDRLPMVLYAGRIHPEKGLDLLVEAWLHPQVRKTIPSWKLVLAGPWAVAQGGGGEEYKNRLVDKIATVANSVEWTGPLFGKDGHRLSALYRQASVFVYPSIAAHGEALPLAPVEAMAAATPCIVSDLDCFKDYLHPNENGLIFAHQANNPATALAHTLVNLASNPTLRTQLGAAAWETASHFRVEEVATNYLTDFESLLSNRPQ